MSTPTRSGRRHVIPKEKTQAEISHHVAPVCEVRPHDHEQSRRLDLSNVQRWARWTAGMDSWSSAQVLYHRAASILITPPESGGEIRILAAQIKLWLTMDTDCKLRSTCLLQDRVQQIGFPSPRPSTDTQRSDCPRYKSGSQPIGDVGLSIQKTSLPTRRRLSGVILFAIGHAHEKLARTAGIAVTVQSYSHNRKFIEHLNTPD